MVVRKKEGHAYLSAPFVRAIRAFHLPLSQLVGQAGISYGVFVRWAERVNRTATNDPRIMKLAEVVNYQGQIFE